MKTILITLFLTSLLFGCVKNETLTPTTQITANINPATPAISTGSFASGAHPTSGSIKVAEDAQDKTKKYLVFENFRTDAGPDLKIYLSDDLKATNFVEVAKLDKTGNFSELIPATADLNKQKYVLIWCKQFTVLFGSAQLQ
jgi:Electron transfer DM13